MIQGTHYPERASVDIVTSVRLAELITAIENFIDRNPKPELYCLGDANRLRTCSLMMKSILDKDKK